MRKQRKSFATWKSQCCLPAEIPHPETLPAAGPSWVPSETREPRCKGRSGAGAADLAGSGTRAEGVWSRASREVGLRGTGSDGEYLAPVLGNTQAGKCGHMSRGACVSP